MIRPTEKRYLDNPYETSFTAEVVAVEPHGDGARVTLDRSCFYPESGGQLSDRGRLGSATVVDVLERDGVVEHIVTDGGAVGSGTVAGEIDWARRFDHMQQHTGQHVLSRAFIEEGRLYTVSFHMGDDTCTIDLEGDGFDEDVARRAEALANRVIVENRDVIVRTAAPGELETLELRRAVPDGVTDVRIVEVRDFDVIACCGTHVRATGELGAIKVLRWENVKNAVRVYFKAGNRAHRDYAEKHDVVQALMRNLTTSADDLAAKVAKLTGENKSLARQVSSLSKKVAGYDRIELLESARTEGGVRFVAAVCGSDEGYARLLSSELKSEPGTLVILATDGGTVVCAAADDVKVDFGATAVALVRDAGGRGGGKGSFAQLRLPEGADVTEFLKRIEDNVKQSLS